MMQPAKANLAEFEAWKTLAMEDPVQFEAMRLQAIEQFFAQVPSDKQLQLRRLQWRIDRVRERAGTPLAACVELSRMMWDSFSQLRDCYQEMRENGQPRPTQPVQRTAKVLEFQRAKPELAEV